MFKKILGLSVLIIAAVVIASCTIISPVTATSNPVGSKTGESSSTLIMGWPFDGGDNSIATAAKNGGITKISTVDSRLDLVFLTFIMKKTTIITGE